MMKIFPTELPTTLGFDIIIQKLSDFCIGKAAKQNMADLKPSTDAEWIKMQLQETTEFIHANALNSVQNYPELEKEISILRVKDAVLSALQCKNIRTLIQICNEAILFYEEKKDIFPSLYHKTMPNLQDKIIIEYIDDTIDKDAIVKDDASEALKNYRIELQDNRRQTDRIYKAHIQRLRKAGQLAEIEENFINGRKTLGILAEYKREIKGILLSQSASGKIVFIEPQNAIQLNNDRLEIENEEQKEIYKILKQTTEYIRPFYKNIIQFVEMMVGFDMLNARCMLAKTLQAHHPIIQMKDTIDLQKAFHPILFIQNNLQKNTTIPFDCVLDMEKRIMVISGPNAGGKSITLKTIGLLQMMFQSGLFITAHPKSEMCVLENLFGDIGDNQSIEDGLSTYSARLMRMNYFLKNTNDKTLFLIDEFGTGSDPDMGGALAEVILNKLNDKKSKGVVTTHFTNLKLLANHAEGIFNACMLFNSKTLKPLYQLHLGEPGSSFTFEVAHKTGMDSELILEAKSKVSKEKVKMDKLLNQLQVEKNNLEKLKRDIQKQMSKTTAEKREFKDLNEKLEESLLKHKENKDEKQKLIEYGKKLHQLILDEYFSKTQKTIWLSTETNSRAELFYKKQGWKNEGFHGEEIKLEMSFKDWKK